MRTLRLLLLTVGLLAIAVVGAGCGNLLASGTGLSCVVQKDGVPSCFGAGGTPSEVALPKGYGAADIAVGGGAPNGQTAACAAAGKSGSSGGQIWCWGDDTYGQLGRGAAGAASATPVRVNLGSGRDSSTVAVGGTSACAVTTDGFVCWGDNTNGQLGTATPGIAAPAVVAGSDAIATGKGVTSSPNLVALGRAHACGGVSEAILCWGAGTAGQLGNGASADSSALVKVTLPIGVSSLAAGGDSTCASGSDKKSTEGVWCWGAIAGANAPKQVALPDIVSPSRVAVGFDRACAVMSDSTVWCWSATAAPTQVRGVKATLVSVGQDQTCASLTNGRLRCWGAVSSVVPGIDGLRAPVAKRVRTTGTAAVGSTLTAVTAAWPFAERYRYQWQRQDAKGEWQSIRGATRQTLKLRPALAGASVRVEVSGENAWTEAGAVFSESRDSSARVVAG